MARTPPDPSAPVGWRLALYTVLAVIALILIGRLVLNPLFRLVGRLAERELFVVAGLFTVVGAAAVMHSLHLSVPLGAFVAGVMLAESPYRHELETDVEPFRSILLGLFFLSVGMMLDLRIIAERPLFVVGIAAAVIVTKTVLISLISRGFRGTWPQSIRLGLLLSQAGEFGFVLFGQAASARLITPEAASLFSAIVTLTMISTPFLMQVIEWVLRRIPEPPADLEGPEFSPETNVIVVGYGRFGQTVAQMLMAKRIPVTIIDSKPSQIELSEEFGTKVYYGDGTRVDLLRTAGAENAEGILFCQNPKELTRDKLEAVFASFPHVAIMARVYDRLQVIDFEGLELAVCQRELYESAVVMGREALIKLGVARREAERVEREYRERDLERLEAQTVSGDLHAKFDRSFGVDRPLADEVPDPA